MADFFIDQHEAFLKALNDEELIEYVKFSAIVQLKPFLRKWIVKHFGRAYLEKKIRDEQTRLDNLTFYYAITK